MILGFRHRGLKRLYERGDRGRIPSQHVAKVERILARLDVTTEAWNMDLPGYRLHPLSGRLQGFWSVTVSDNLRLIFRLDAGSAFDVDLIDYH